MRPVTHLSLQFFAAIALASSALAQSEIPTIQIPEEYSDLPPMSGPG